MREDNPEDDVVSTWSVAGADAGKFAIGNGGASPDFTRGELRFKAKPDYEAPGDADKDNVYEGDGGGH